MRFAFSSLVAILAATSVVAQPFVKRAKIQINPDRSAIRPEFAAEVAASAPAPEPQTNAKRFAAGLPPLPPRAHRRRPHNGAPHAGTKIDTAPRAVSSPSAPVNVRCNLFAKNVADGSPFGFLKAEWNEYGEYGLFQSDQAGALEVSFSYVPEEPTSLSGLDLSAVNGPSGNYPFVGLTTGYSADEDDIGPESWNYGYVVGTGQTPKGSPPSSTVGNTFSWATNFEENTESAVWSYDPVTGAIAAQWINTDGSAPATHLLKTQDANNNDVLIFTGDVSAFNGVLEASFPEVALTCVSPVITTVEVTK